MVLDLSIDPEMVAMAEFGHGSISILVFEGGCAPRENRNSDPVTCPTVTARGYYILIGVQLTLTRPPPQVSCC